MPGGIDTVVAGIVRYSPDDVGLVVIGADRSGERARRLGAVEPVSLDGRTIGFLPVTRLGGGGRSGLFPETLKLAFGIWRHRRRIVAAVDRLQVHRSETGLVAAWLLRRLPRVQCIHGDSARALRERTGSYWRFLRGLHLRVERASVRRARRTFVFSRSGAERLRSVCERVEYLPTWFDPSRVQTRLEPTDSPARALWVGRFEEEKDPLLALAALEAFIERVEGRAARMLGGGALLEATQRARGSAAVELAGPVDVDAVASAMADADVFLMTSRFEGSPVVMSESLAAGTPVVATAESDPDERIVDGDNGFGSVARTPEALAAAMEQALTVDRRACVDSVRDLAAPAIVPRLFAGPLDVA